MGKQKPLIERFFRSHFSSVSLKGFSQKGFGAHSICATVRMTSENDKRIRLLVKLLKERFKK